MFERSSGVLLHPTSLAGPFGIGDLGPGVDRWLDWLVEAGCRYWQVLPLGPTGYADSPYQSFSSFAGNPLLISPELLVEDGLAAPADLPSSGANESFVDYGEVIDGRDRLFTTALARFDAAHPLRADYEEFCTKASWWLDDYATFMAIKARNPLLVWTEWDPPLRDRDPIALDTISDEISEQSDGVRLRQWLFDRQWRRVRAAAADRHIEIIGDLPLYVAHDSADVWVNRSLFELHEDGTTDTVAGVPPDYFSETGQRWGNPIYDWDTHAKDGYRWWSTRFESTLRQVDVVRIDHFRGIADYWAIPADEPTAAVGEWRAGPGARLFNALSGDASRLPFIAEDLGELSAAVTELLNQLGYPGMKILQFAFDGRPGANPFAPEAIEDNSVVYTGTHDNDTTVGWFAGLGPRERTAVLHRLGGDGSDIAWQMLQATWMTRANLAIAPMQDLLGLPTKARMNRPGTTEGNWRWRLREGELSEALATRLADVNRDAQRHVELLTVEPHRPKPEPESPTRA